MRPESWFEDMRRPWEDDGNLTAEAFSVEARWLRLLAAVQLHYHRHLDGRASPPPGCQVCRVYVGDFWE